MSNKTDLPPKSPGGAAEGSGSADNGGGGQRSSDAPAAPSHSSSSAGEGKSKTSEGKDKDQEKTDEEDQQAGEADPSRACCFCWCCCCSCSCLTVKNNEENPQKNFSDVINGDEAVPSVEEVRSWGDSFERLMKSPGGRKVFREFLKCEYSEENILFWLACEDLKKESNPSIVEQKARIIYDNYVSTLSPKEVSLDSRVRNIIDDNMKDPTPHTFDDAQLQIYTLMHRDSYPRFVSSSTYRRLAQLNSTSRKESVA